MDKKMRRFLVSAEFLQDAISVWLPLPEAVARHAVRVLRLGEDDVVDLRDGCGRARVGRLRCHDQVWGVVFQEPLRLLGHAERRAIWLAPPLLKGPRFDWLLEKAAELGADVIAPWLAERAVVQWKSERGDDKLVRWRRILEGATRQSNAVRVPELRPPQSLRRLLQDLAEHEVDAVCADPSATSGPLPLVEPGAMAVFTGPEGGFTEQELALLAEHGARSVSLGPGILRGETAPIAVLAAIRIAELT